MVISDISTQRWVYYGKLRDVGYDDAYVVFRKQAVPKTYVTYTVKKSDTLWEIARKHKTTVAALAKLNDLRNPSLIVVGQKIKIREE